MEEKMENISTGVFTRVGKDEVSERGFFFILTLCLLWGLLLTALIAHTAVTLRFQPGIPAIIGLLVLPLAGTILAIQSSKPVLSFLGYNLIIIPWGFLLGPLLNRYNPGLVRNAFILTAIITVQMGTLGFAFPKFFERIGFILLIGLFSLLIIRLAQSFCTFLNIGAIEYISAGIFSCYIGYDMYRSLEVPRTIDNAIDISIELYLDIVNLFLITIRILKK